jgi:signal transduction histidine kinase
LLSNAIKFSPKGSVVSIYCAETQEQTLIIEVKDRGRGIAPEDQELLFQKFRQVTNAKNPLVKGTGLGLAIARALVEEHGGKIGVRSVPGEGSTFYFTITEWHYKKNQTYEAAA